MDNLLTDSIYVTSLEEILWGLFLVALTIAIHTYGMLVIIRADFVLTSKKQNEAFHLMRSMGRIVLLSWGIVMIHLLEVGIWAGFFFWKSIMPNLSTAFYIALMDYTTLGASYVVSNQWRLLEGMIAIVGLITFAWSTGVLFSFVSVLQTRHLEFLKTRRV